MKSTSLDKVLVAALDGLDGSSREHAEALSRELESTIEWSVDGLRAAALSPDKLSDNLRQFAVWLYARSRDGSLDRTLRALAVDDPSPDVRFEAVKGLSLFAGESHRALLHRLVTRDDSEIVRMVSISTIGELPYDSSSETLLLSVLRNPTEPSIVRSAVPEALLSLGGSSEALQSLRRIAAKEKDPDILFMTVFALGQAEDAEALQALRKIAGSKELPLSQWGSVQREAQLAIDNLTT